MTAGCFTIRDRWENTAERSLVHIVVEQRNNFKRERGSRINHYPNVDWATSNPSVFVTLLSERSEVSVSGRAFGISSIFPYHDYEQTP